MASSFRFTRLDTFTFELLTFLSKAHALAKAGPEFATNVKPLLPPPPQDRLSPAESRQPASTREPARRQLEDDS